MIEQFGSWPYPGTGRPPLFYHAIMRSWLRAVGSMSRMAQFLLFMGWGLGTTEEVFSNVRLQLAQC
jgi:hypothetical protein